MTGLVYRLYARAGADRLVWRWNGQRLRILVYHGICEDHLAAEPWIPSAFVSRSAFARQLEYLRREASVLPLEEAAARLADGSLPPRAVSLTFDDGYANNLRLGIPLLRQHGVHATVFLSSHYVESGEMFPFVKLKLIRQMFWDRMAAGLPDYETTPIDRVRDGLAPWWAEAEPRLTGIAREALRPMNVAEVRSADRAVVSFGAHSDTHCILCNEDAGRRRREVALSVEKVGAWSGRPVRAFAYPNGQAGDFGETDKQALRDAGVRVALSGIPGTNGPDTDFLELRRYPIGKWHDAARFAAEVTGFRSAARRLARSWQV